MFTAELPVVPYSDPWVLPLRERLRALAIGKRRIAYFYEQPNNSTFRYRAYNMAQVLNDTERFDISAAYFFLDDLQRVDYLADLADLLVVCRSGYCHRLNDLIMKFKRQNKRVLFDVDDLVFNPDFVHLIIATLGQNVDNAAVWDYWYAYTGRMGAALRLCDSAITTNNYLAQKVADYSGLPVTIVPNFINREQLDLSERLFHKKEASEFARDGKIHLGYFSGSPSHDLDFEIILSALETVLDNDPRIELMVAGYVDPDALRVRFGKRVSHQRFRDFVNLQRLVGGVEFNLMPLQSNVFTHCKSELKYFEAAIAGTLSIASPSYTYASAIRDGDNGYIARGHQWASIIRRAIENIDQYQEMATAAFIDACTKYAWFNQRKIILNALGFE
jgi:glycosyltransferase involved in cell wall biosynthesis